LATQNFRVKNGLEVGIGATILIAESGGNIGINSTQPTAKLDVNGTLSVSGVSTFSDDANFDNGTLYVDSTTNTIGIGTDAPNTGGGTIIADIRGGIKIGADTVRRLSISAGSNGTISQQNGSITLYGGGTSGSEVGILNNSNIYLKPNTGGVDLYYGKTDKKFETTGAGATVFGTLDTERLNVASVADKTTIFDGNNITLSYNTGGGNVAICTNPSGPITLNVIDIPTTSDFDNRAISFAVIVQQGTTAYGCTAATLNGVSFDSTYTVGTGTHISYPGGTVSVGNTSGYDVFNFTGINTVGSASTTENYKLLSNLNGDYRLWS